MIKFSNIEDIIKILNKEIDGFEYIIKYDGITIEFESKDVKNVDRDIKKVKDVLLQVSLVDFTVEKHKQISTRFSIQFPNLNPKYTNSQVDKMYKDNFKWLLEDSVRNKPDLTRQYVISNADKYIRLAIKSYCRSNINKYKESENHYLQNIEYRQKLLQIFLQCVEELMV